MTSGFFISRGRVYFLIGLLCLAWGVIVARLVHIQLAHGDEYFRIASRQTNGEIVVPAERGGIFDDKGRAFAGNIARRSFFAYPQNDQDAARIADEMAPLMGLPAKQLHKTLAARIDAFTWLCRKMPDDKSEQLVASNLPGLFHQKEMQRVYPNENLGRDLLGMVDIDNNGISGLEYALNTRLIGSDGKTRVERDAVGNIYRVASKDVLAPRNGNNVRLTIDLDWQSIVEEELRFGVDTFGAQSGIAILVRPNDGAVLSMAAYYPHSAGGASQKNEAISDVFEPGSVFKLVSAAGALEEGALGPDSRVDCGGGVATFSGKLIHDDHKHGLLSVRDVFRFSSNIGIARVALKLGSKNMYKYAKYFGFGRKVGIDLPGEANGLMREPPVWSDFFTASFAMGHGVSISALQLVAAFSVVPSNGTLYQPYIVKEVVGPDGIVIDRTQPTKIRTFLSPKTCALLRQFMEAVVDSGTAKYSKSDMVDFAGKTGTGQKPDPKNGGYFQNRYTSTFAGYFPSDEPIAVGVVVLDDPQPVHYAGMTSGRIFKRIAERIATVQHLPTSPEYAAKQIKEAPVKIRVPDLQGHTLSTVEDLLDTLGLEIAFINAGDIISRQVPEEGSLLGRGERLILYLADPDTTYTNQLNELVGLSLRSAVPKLMEWGYDFAIQGSGYVKSVVPLVPDSVAVVGARSVQVICGVD
jgi:cell division protein FtsI (penicillin-binding protein 3)